VRTSPLRRSSVDHTVLPANTPHLPLPRSSPEGATTEWTVIAPADEAYYSLIDPERMKGWVGLVGWPTADGLPIFKTYVSNFITLYETWSAKRINYAHTVYSGLSEGFRHSLISLWIMITIAYNSISHMLSGPIWTNEIYRIVNCEHIANSST